MPHPAIKTDFTGRTFGRLTALSFCCSEGSSKRLWSCKCLCGNETVVKAYDLKSGNTRSCGCLRKEAAASAGVKRITKKWRNVAKAARLNSIPVTTLKYHIRLGRSIGDAVERILERKEKRHA